MTKLIKKLTPSDLNDIHYIARQYYIDDQKHPFLDDQQYRSQCFTKAICTVLNIQGVEFPEPINKEPFDE